MTERPIAKTAAWLQAAVASACDECLLWPFAVDAISGYGIVRINNKTRTAHRAALVLATGQDPEGMDAAHGPCHDRRCCNPRHLSWKTPTANHADKVRDDTHNRGVRQYRAKLTSEKVLAIVADDREHKVIAADYGVSRSVVSAIKTGLHWNWLTKIKETKRARKRKPKNGTTQAPASVGNDGGGRRGDGGTA